MLFDDGRERSRLRLSSPEIIRIDLHIPRQTFGPQDARARAQFHTRKQTRPRAHCAERGPSLESVITCPSVLGACNYGQLFSSSYGRFPVVMR